MSDRATLTPLSDFEASRTKTDCDDSCCEVYVRVSGVEHSGDIVTGDFARSLERRISSMTEAIAEAIDATNNGDWQSGEKALRRALSR